MYVHGHKHTYLCRRQAARVPLYMIVYAWFVFVCLYADEYDERRRV
jgi:hypothetical protein